MFQFIGASNYFFFGGRANYVKGYGDEIAQSFSWMDTRRTFGFFQVWTSEEECYNS